LDLDSFQKSDTQIVHMITTIMRGGAENQLLILVLEQVRLGQKVHVLFLKGESELAREFELSGAIVHRDFANLKPPIQIIAIRKFLSTSRFEGAIIHGHLPRAQIIAAYSVNKSQRLICSRHDEDKFYPEGKLLSSRLIFKLIDRRIDQWIAISQSVRSRMIKYGEIPRKNEIEVVHYGFESAAHAFDSSLSAKIKMEYKLNESNYVIGCVARLVWQKDHSTLLRAFRTYHLGNPKAKLILIGDGPMRGQLAQLAQELEISNSVVFAGKVSTVREHLEILDVFILPSTTEGFGLVLLEAMEAELPIIASNISAIPEVMGDCGLLFETGNSDELAIKIELFESPDTRESYSRLSRKRLMEYAPEIMCLKIMKIYEKAARN